MRVVASFIIKHPGGFFLGGLALAVIFAIVVADSQRSLSFGLSATLTLLLSMESPRHVLQNPHLPMQNPHLLMVVFGWLICVVGWLLLPVVIGMMIDAATWREETEVESEQSWRLRLYHYLKDQDIPPDKIDEAVDDLMKGFKILKEKHLRKS